MAAVARGIDGNALVEITQVDNHADGGDQAHTEIVVADIPHVVVDALGTASGGDRTPVDQGIDRSDAAQTERVADEGRLVQHPPLPLAAVPAQRGPEFVPVLRLVQSDHGQGDAPRLQCRPAAAAGRG